MGPWGRTRALALSAPFAFSPFRVFAPKDLLAFALPLPDRVCGSSAHDPVAFPNEDELIRCDGSHLLLPPARPPHHHPLCSPGSPQPKQRLQLAGGAIARAASHPPALPPSSRLHFH